MQSLENFLEPKIEELQNSDIHAWIIAENIRTEGGVHLDFHDHRYLQDIYWDDSPNLVEMKAAQLGLSTMEIFRTLWRAKNKRLDCVYILPTFTAVRDFVGGKVNRIIDQNPVLQQWVKDKDSIEQKKVDNNTIYYRGSENERAAIMITADWLVLDEYDRCNQKILEIYESRLQHSKYGYKSIFSNPSTPDFGVHKYYKRTDQKMWHITHACGKTFPLNEGCINYQKKLYECPVCHGEISDEERRLGEWQSTVEGEEGWSGYWLPLWINPRVPASKIAEYKRTKSAEYFSNFVAGLPYYGSGNKVTYETVANCLSDKINEQSERIIIGVDTGLPIYITIGNKEGIFFYGTLSDPSTGRDPYKELELLLRKWPKSIIISDQGGDLIGIRKLQAQYPGRVFLTWYRQDRKTQELIQWGTGDKYGEVVADRNRMIQLVIDEMVEKRITLNSPQYGLSQKEIEAEWHDYIVHWLNIYRQWEYDEQGEVDKEKGFKWERQGPDHWVHATVYWRIGMDKFSNTNAEIVGSSPTAGLPRGQEVHDDKIILAYGKPAF